MPAAIVQTISSSEYAERPVSLTWQGERLEISQILGRWRTPDGKHFRVRTSDNQLFELNYWIIQDEWQIQPL